MRRARRHLGIVLALALCVTLAFAGAAEAKKKKKKRRGPSTVDITQIVNAPIPDPVPGTQQFLSSTIEVPQQFKGQVIRDVNVTVQTAGVTGTTPASDLQAMVRSPNGTWVTLLVFLMPPTGENTPSIGPLTFDDEAPFDLGGGNRVNPNLLYSPWQGSATPGDPFTPLFPLRYYLSDMDEGPATGTWTLRFFDFITGETSNLVSWRLNATVGRPFKVKGK